MRHVTKVNEGRPTASAGIVTRRGSLGAGVMLAVGAIDGPRPVIADEAIRRPYDAELAAILDRPIDAQCLAKLYKTCHCALCAAVRREPYRCTACGFSGVPMVFPCECAEDWARHVQDGEEELRDPAAFARRMALATRARREIKRELQALRKKGPPSLCTPPNVRCAHLARTCPVCGSAGVGDPPFAAKETQTAVAEMIRDLRAALGARGLI